MRNISTFFCAMCWRPIEIQQKRSIYCILHNQSLGSAEYKKRKRQLLALSEAEQKRLESIIPSLSRRSKKSKSPDKLNRIVESNKLPNDFVSSRVYVLELCTENFPSLSETLNLLDVERFNNFIEWGEAIVRRYDKEYFQSICSSWSNNCRHLTPSEQRRYFFHMLSRLHVEQLELVKPKRGPEPGSRPLNKALFIDLLSALDEQRELNITPRLSQIARKHSVTRQTVHKKWKLLQQNEIVYRKVMG